MYRPPYCPRDFVLIIAGCLPGVVRMFVLILQCFVGRIRLDVALIRVIKIIKLSVCYLIVVNQYKIKLLSV